ncbi:hypothetical protein HZA41_02180 [Candidatus Peregrinibacteria bacterium]|nr:hypothetical protein [Candidatus Peregrinibacteria bacterium]
MSHLDILKTNLQKLQNAGNYIFARRVIRLAGANIWRNKFLSAATIAVIALILFSFNIILAINMLGDAVIEKLNGKVDIILYLNDDADLLAINNLINDLTELPEIKSAIYTSQEDALKGFVTRYGENGDPFTKYGLENTLPANIQIVTASPKDHKKILEFVKSVPEGSLFTNIEENTENKTIAEKLILVTGITKKIMWGIVSAFLIGGILIIVNSISLTLHSRKNEIAIMKLVGAKYTFIRLPFVIEGAVYGLLAVGISLILFQIFLGGIGLQSIENDYTLPLAAMGKIFLLETVISMGIGILSSQIAIHRYFHEKS